MDLLPFHENLTDSVLNIEVVCCESEREISFLRNVIMFAVVWDWTQHDLQISGSLVGLVVKKVHQHPEQNWFRVIETQTWQCVIQILQSFVKKESHLKLNSVNWSWQSSLQLNRIFFLKIFLCSWFWSCTFNYMPIIAVRVISKIM